MSLRDSSERHLIMLASEIKLALKRKRRRRPPNLTTMATNASEKSTNLNLVEDRFFPLIRCNTIPGKQSPENNKDNESGTTAPAAALCLSIDLNSEQNYNNYNNNNKMQVIREHPIGGQCKFGPSIDRRHTSISKLHFQASASGGKTPRPSHRHWRPSTTTTSGTTRALISLTVLIVSLLLNANCPLFQGDHQLVTQVSCQTSNTFLANGNQNQQLPQQNQPPQSDPIMESRSETALGPNNLLQKQQQQQQPNSIAISQLVNFLHSINNNQQQQQQQNSQLGNNNNQRRSQQQPLPLPLGTMGNQRASMPQPISSTPVNPFLAAAQFQPTRRQHYQPQPPPQSQSNGYQTSSATNANNFVSSPAPPPTLMLNRIPNQFSNSAPGGGGFTNLQTNANRFNGNQLEPINTIPLGLLANQNQNSNSISISSSNNNNNNRVQMPPALSRGGQQMRPYAGQTNGQQQPPQPQYQSQLPPPPQTMRSPLMPPPQLVASNGNGNSNSNSAGFQSQPRPIMTGFAPSGPPPSSAANSAISVVQSPPNAIGVPIVQNSPSQMVGTQTEPSPTTKTTSTTTTTTTTAAATTTNKAYQFSEASSSPSIVPVATTTSLTTTSSSGSSTTTPSPATTTPNQQQQTSTGGGSGGSGDPPISEQPQPVTSSANQDDQSQNSSAKGSSQLPTLASQWSPVNNRTSPTGGSTRTQLSSTQTSLAPSPDIVTVPPGYNPDQPVPQQNYDIAVSAQMGPSLGGGQPPNSNSNQQQPTTISSIRSNDQNANNNSNNSDDDDANDNSMETLSTAASSIELPTPTVATPIQITIAPTETTTIIWSSESTSVPSTIQPTRVQQYPGLLASMQSTIMPTTAPAPPPTTTTTTTTSATPAISTNQANSAPSASSSSSQQPPVVVPSRIRDSSHVSMIQNDEPQQQQQQDPGVVYGKAPSREAKPTRPPPTQQQQLDQAAGTAGRPFIQTAALDSQVRPYSAGTQSLFKSNHGTTSSDHHPLPFKPSKPLTSGSQMASSGMSVGSGFTIVASGNQTMPLGDIQDYVAGAPPPITSASSGANEPTISAQGGPDPASFDLSQEASSSAGVRSSSHQQQHQQGAPSASSTQAPMPAPRLRRPTFKPKPAVPPIRIDSCIVGDDSSCDQSHNERCVTEYGISSCHCKPGYARLSQLRGYCSPISLLQFNLKIDKLSDDRRLVYNQTLDNPNSEEYQYLEFETIQALASAIQQTPLAKQFMGARVNKFYDRKSKVWANVSLSLEANNVTRSERVQQVAGQELAKLVQSRQRQPLGESMLVLDGSKESISKLVDVNECSSKELNDCSTHATCTNEFGGFSCQCLPGFEDKHLQQHEQQQQQQQQQGSSVDSSGAAGGTSATIDKGKLGRICMGCSASYCSNRGECSVIDGKKQCKCRPNFMGARCDIDSEVLFVAIGGSLVGLIILIITFWCLFVFNRRWRREQQKMDAMSATSGLTYNYVNSPSNSSNSLMSPTRASIASGPLGRSSAAYAAMGQRFNGGGGGGSHFNSSRQHQHHHTAFGLAGDQQAIIGSTSSGSSAASQPIACNPYAAAAAAAAASAAQYQYEDTGGLLIAPASTGGSSEQTSPGGNSYQGATTGGHNSNHSAAYLAATAAGSAYTLSGHHHHHNHHLSQHNYQQQLMQPHHQHHHHHAHMHHTKQQQQQHQLVSQFHPALDYMRTLNTSASTAAAAATNYQQQLVNSTLAPNGYDTRWRTLQDNNSKQQSLTGYYLVR